MLRDLAPLSVAEVLASAEKYLRVACDHSKPEGQVRVAERAFDHYASELVRRLREGVREPRAAAGAGGAR